MKTVEIVPVYVDIIPWELEANKVYISEKYSIAIHNCLCGCGARTVTPLINDWWALTKHTDGTVSFKPSILNAAKKGLCGAHYVINNNKAVVTIEK